MHRRLAVRESQSSPYSPLGILRQALASPKGRRGEAKSDGSSSPPPFGHNMAIYKVVANRLRRGLTWIPLQFLL
ncbi:MAG: hypothetical protein V7K54_05455 [Nostoc sp.]